MTSEEHKRQLTIIRAARDQHAATIRDAVEAGGVAAAWRMCMTLQGFVREPSIAKDHMRAFMSQTPPPGSDDFWTLVFALAEQALAAVMLELGDQQVEAS